MRAGNLSNQHHLSSRSNEHVLLFDNGSHRGAPITNYSRIVEIDPTSNEIVWDYRGEPAVPLYSYRTIPAERQPNGNTFICEGAAEGIDVTMGNQIVCEFINPLFADSGRVVGGSADGRANSVFRAHRYAVDSPALQGRDLDPDLYGNLDRISGTA